jgi:uncharacterized protein
MPNHLIDASSPYLLQHAHNPVDWYPWGAEALERARRENKPIFLSIGYAACHWCHVMEHQCFENADIAARMNAHFINIKVDREERPDLDDLYMLATQLMTGTGGWPMSVWLTPTLEPFYAGTYFPPADSHGRPGFPRLLAALRDTWQNRRADLIAQSARVVEAIRMHADETAGPSPEIQIENMKIENLLPRALEQFADRFDDVHGGLGSAPKFPPHQALQFWLAILNVPDWKRTGLAISDHGILGQKVALTLNAMKNGGIYDHVGGAFARYATDEQWLIPHFEKMLYDNAQLAPVYAQASVLYGDPDYARVARGTLDFFLREMYSEQGAFFSSLDADSEGAEGKYYVWTLADIHAALPNPDDAALLINHFHLTAEGNWPESPVPNGNILFTTEPTDDNPSIEKRNSKIDNLLLTLRDFRSHRPRPTLDDKILTSWNALMLSALAIASSALNEPRYLAAAHRLVAFLLSHHLPPTGLQRVSRHGKPAHTPAFLDDHAFLLNALIDLLETRPVDPIPFQDAAIYLADALLRDFQDPVDGGFYFTGPQHEQLFTRMKNAADNALPSANGVAIRALLRLSRITNNSTYGNAARRAIEAFHPHVARRPDYFPTTLLALLDNSLHTTGSSSLAAPVTSMKEEAANASTVLSLTASPLPSLAPGATFDLTFHLTIAPGYHIQPTTPAPGAISTAMHLRSPAQILATQSWTFPPTQLVAGTPAFADHLDIQASCKLSRAAPPGAHTLRAILTAQPCTADACLRPEQVTLDIPLTIRPN